MDNGRAHSRDAEVLADGLVVPATLPKQERQQARWCIREARVREQAAVAALPGDIRSPVAVTLALALAVGVTDTDGAGLVKMEIGSGATAAENSAAGGTSTDRKSVQSDDATTDDGHALDSTPSHDLHQPFSRL